MFLCNRFWRWNARKGRRRACPNPLYHPGGRNAILATAAGWLQLAAPRLASVTALVVASACTMCAPAQSRQGAADADFPAELVKWSPRPGNPIFTAEGAGHWDVKIRERGWILHDDNQYQLWFTGYDGTKGGKKML